MITILYRNNPQAYFHALFPILQSPWASHIYITEDLNFCLKQDRNEVIVVMGIFKGKYQLAEQNIAFLQKLKKKYRKLVFFDDSDGADSLHTELIESVDLYYKKQLLIDRSQYLKPAYGRQHFSEYYHQNVGIEDPNPDNREALKKPEELNKLRLFWNIGAAVYPKSKINRKLAYTLASAPFHMLRNPFYQKIGNWRVPIAQRVPAIQTRFSDTQYTPSIGYQRKQMLKQVSGKKGLLMGRISQEKFNWELKNVLAVLSPFGWGEICHRDFEAFYFGTLLIKPTCEHLETWPNVFLRGETYVSINWNLENMLAKLDHILAHPKEYQRMALEGHHQYRCELETMTHRVEQIIQELLG